MSRDGSGEVCLGRISKASVKKTIYYLKRNGVKKTWHAVRERLEERRKPPYIWVPLPETELEAQRTGWEEKGFTVRFSILVPAYRTKPEYLRELIDSLLCQTYPGWELILADATEDNSVGRLVRDCSDSRIHYVHLERNAGIAENTNQAIPYASGDYVGLLDHDDILTENALYEMAAAIEEGKRQGMRPRMLYSDEDKCNGDRTEYYEPNFKEDFNLDLLLSNNYICHFLVMDRELIGKLKFRSEYDGAQDYDLVLRAAAELGGPAGPKRSGEPWAPSVCLEKERMVVHIPKVLYHWRCHTGSTAENPQSKLYAYEAGRLALQDFADRAGWRAKAAETAHVGFYRLEYEGSLFECRPDIGAIGGRLVSGRPEGRDIQVKKARGTDGKSAWKRRVVGGMMTEEGRVCYENLPVHYSGYLHRGALSQDGAAVDIRNIRIRPECRELFQKVTGIPYRTVLEGDRFDASLLPENCDHIQLSLELCRALRNAGYRILYLPL